MGATRRGRVSGWCLGRACSPSSSTSSWIGAGSVRAISDRRRARAGRRGSRTYPVFGQRCTRPRNRGTTLDLAHVWRPHPRRRAVQPRSRSRPAPLPSSRRCAGHGGTTRQPKCSPAWPLQCPESRNPSTRPRTEPRRRPREGSDGGLRSARLRRRRRRQDRREARRAVHATASQGGDRARSRARGARRRRRSQIGRGARRLTENV